LYNLKQIALGLHQYHDVHKHFPAAVVPACCLPPESRWSWLTELLPFVEQQPLHCQIQTSLAWDDPENREVIRVSLAIYQCPAFQNKGPADPVGLGHYVGIAGLGADAASLPEADPRAGFFGYDRWLTTRDIADGLGHTLAVAETAWRNGLWAAGGMPSVRGVEPGGEPYIGEGRAFGMKHRADTFFRTNPYLANVAFADGSARNLDESVSPEVWRALATVAGGEPVPDDF
jgi:prepilin-type processing-associated H-X9-DG protein